MRRDRRVFDNLFSNVVRYGAHLPDAEEADVILESRRTEDGLRIRLSDRAEKETLPDVGRMFERFYKGDGSRGGTESAGPGLSIAKRIVELHGGTITAFVSEDGGRLAAEIRLPADDGIPDEKDGYGAKNGAKTEEIGETG